MSGQCLFALTAIRGFSWLTLQVFTTARCSAATCGAVRIRVCDGGAEAAAEADKVYPRDVRGGVPAAVRTCDVCGAEVRRDDS